MIDNKYLSLMHGEIDGANSPKESMKLQNYLAAHAEAQRFYDELVAMAALLQEVKSVEPPPHLEHTIMNALPPRRYPPPEKHGFVPEAGQWLAANFELKYAFTFAGGVAVAVLLFALFLHPSLKDDDTDWSKLHGMIGAPHSAENLLDVRRLEIQLPEVTGTITLKNAGNIIVVESKLDSPQPLDLVIAFDEQALGFKGFSLRDESARTEVTLNTTMIRLTRVEHKAYTFIFEKRTDATAKMNIQILCSNNLLYENELAL
jgi:hypothetical protein